MATTGTEINGGARSRRATGWRAIDFGAAGRRILAPFLGMAALTVGVGLLITNVLTGTWLIDYDVDVSREVAGDRTAGMNDITDFVTSMSDTPVIVVATAICAIAFRLVFKRWRESIFLILAVWSQSLIFLLATVLAQRPRPKVVHLDPAPPTSSWPSGHTSAAVAFYVGLAVVLTLHSHRHTLLKVLWWVLLLPIPFAIAASRLYRGMHHLTDITWGLLLGFGCVAVMAAAILLRPVLKGER